MESAELVRWAIYCLRHTWEKPDRDWSTWAEAWCAGIERSVEFAESAAKRLEERSKQLWDSSMIRAGELFFYQGASLAAQAAAYLEKEIAAAKRNDTKARHLWATKLRETAAHAVASPRSATANLDFDFFGAQAIKDEASLR